MKRGKNMKKTYSKRIWTALCAVLVLTALPGCKNETEEIPESSTSVTKTSEAAEVSEETELSEPEGGPPARPDGENPPEMQGDGEPPARPDGENPPEMQGDGEPPAGPGGEDPPEKPGGFGAQTDASNGTAANIIDSSADVSGEKYSSLGDDENALRIDGAAVTLNGITAKKSGGSSSNTENGDFYGQNAAILALNGAEVTIKNAEVSSDAVNGNGVFSYGSGTTVNIYDTVIRTNGRNSGGIQTTGGGTTNAYNLDVETQGTSSAAIRSDRGGGEVNVSGGSYVTNGTGSPAIYCTADIDAENAVLTANSSEGIVVEGKNSVSLENCTVTGNMKGTYGDDTENIHNIMIYQSMSGDAEVGKAEFSAEGGSIAASSGDMFYITNTSCEIELENVAFTLAGDTFLRAEGNSSSRGWGKQGENGGSVILEAENQLIEGNIYADEISSLDITLSDNSEFNGAVNPDGNSGKVGISLKDGSKWTLTADSFITSFDGELSDINTNGFKLYINGEEVK